jgi:hypothetical protein
MFRVQYLADARRYYQPTARHANRGRVWIWANASARNGGPVSFLLI